ncbi:MAG TPA: ABC transporter permease [Gemmatimonadaceae bacterium]|jgi:predicted permease|nr:ABC transporter permease [Gemmatimonadaceae bacterium]
MRSPPSDAVVRAYRTLLHLLPTDMRARDGAAIASLFAEEAAEARRRGRAAFVVFVLASAWDVMRRAPYERWRRRGRRSGAREAIMGSFLGDLRFAARSFGRQPGATALVVLTLALGVAANTAVFAIVDGVFVRPFPFPNPDRLVYLNERAPAWNLEFTNITYTDFHTWRERARAFDGMALFAPSAVNLADANGADRVNGLVVTHDFAATLGIRLPLGRTFTPDEDRPDGPRVIVIGHGLWQTRFGGARDVLGTSMRVNSLPYTIIGVLPPEGDFPGNVDFWLPLQGDPNQQGQSYSYDGIARMKAGVTVEQARADLMNAHAPVWAAHDSARVVSPRLDPLREQFAANFRAMGKALGAGALLVLLIACANVAGAMLARSIFRRREIAIRMALGASAGRVGRQLITESLALAIVAGIAGTLLGRWGLTLIIATAPDQVPGWVDLQANVRTGVFSVVVMLLTALIFGLVPALQPRRENVAGSLAWGGGRTSGALPQRRLLDALVVVEIAMALVLLAGSGLLLRAYTQLRSADPGFRTEGVTTFRVSLPRVNYPNGLVQRQFFLTLVERLEAAPGIESAGIVSCLPFGCHLGQFFDVEGAPPRDSRTPNPVVLTRMASPGYFETMGIELARGRYFAEGEGSPRGPHPVIVNEEFVRAKVPAGVDPVGRRIIGSGDTTSSSWMTVVGVVRDVRHYGLTTPMRPGIYLSTTDADSTPSRPSFGVAVRSSSDPGAVASTVRTIVRQMDPELPVIELRTAEAALARSLAPRRAIAFAFVAFGFVALALAVGGIYAVLSYVVGRRRQEIGIRMALGARRSQVVRLVVRQGLRLVALGVAIGLPLALLATGSLASLLVDVSPRDPLTYVLAIGLLAVTAVISALVPARRAAGVDPKTALGDS